MNQVQLTMSRRVGSWTRPHHWSSVKWKCWSLVTRQRLLTFVHRQRWGIVCVCIVADGVRHYQWEGVTDVGCLGMIARRKLPEPSADVDHVVPLDSKLFLKHQGLIHHCAATRYLDGKPRVPGTFSVGTQGMSWVVTLNDLDTAHRIKVIAATLDAALNQAHILVGEPDAPWEFATWLEREAPKKRRK